MSDNAPPRLSPDGLVGREGHRYHASRDLVAAANVALALHRPLLLTGDPGCGKTDFAFAAERALRVDIPESAPGEDMPGLLEARIHSDSRAADLFYHYDALTRFGDSQFDRGERARDPTNYIQLLPLGVALTSPVRRVLLIDEIDKAPRDLPNDLLGPLDRGAVSREGAASEAFTIYEIPPEFEGRGLLRRRMLRPADPAAWPFVVITSNRERELPEPFLRRCVFYHVEFPDRAELLRILQDWFPPDTHPRARAMYEPIVGVFERMRADPRLEKKPSTAELLDWAEVLLGDATPVDDLETIVQVNSAGASRWDRVPALCCLVKSAEDLVTLGLRRAPGV